MTRKDYIKFAEMFLRTKPSVKERGAAIMWIVIMKEAADIFSKDNPRFDEDRFINACVGESVKTTGGGRRG